MRNYLLTLMTLAAAWSCSTDDGYGDDPDTGGEDPVEEPTTEVRSIIINEVEYLVEDQIELYNNGNQTVDLANYWMCLGPGQYFRIGDSAATDIVSGTVSLEPGEFLVISPVTLEASNDAGGLGLYANNDDFASADNIRSFVQWGAAGNAREVVAVAAGIWSAGGFVPNVPNGASIAYDGEGNTQDDWAGTSTITLGAANTITEPVAEVRSVVINEVEYLVDDQIELYNNGNQTVDLANYWMCLGPGQYFRIGDSDATDIISGSVVLEPGEFLVIAPAVLDPSNEAGGLGLYANNDNFASADNIRSFVQWGAAGNAREVVAVEAGIWTAGGFVPNVPNGASIAYDGEGNTPDDWAGTGTITLGAANTFTDPVAEVRSVIINEVEYLVDDQIELYNNGNQTVDLANYWMCLGPGQYFRVGDSNATNIVSGSVTLAPGEFLVISPAVLEASNDAGGLGLYANNDNFGSADNIRSFVQWGAAGNAREVVAVAAGIWNQGGFVPNVSSGQSIAYDGEGFTSTDWGQSNPTLGSANP
ncbi:hypothetical protein [uncultured Croceitalea sp.]|uniref:hypothetical protein n=1 Tax=uncultured Croceitalea sp. TaxID=1798908 RepID=UPI0033062279